ncbi:hypothetical protein [Streptomyces asoensis]|uniref:hypothetical protein n=1 Tax=Streptomyces asoensis TaxID=249586 RepID=UPI0033FE7BA1
MTADWWARGIAIGSAGATALNMGVAYRTFRRARPKVKVKLSRTSLDANPEKGKKPYKVFILRFLNSGTTPASLERIELVAYKPPYRLDVPRVIHSVDFHPESRHESPLIPALSGIIYRFSMVGTRYGKPDSEKLRFRVVLSDGSTVVSRALKNPVDLR